MSQNQKDLHAAALDAVGCIRVQTYPTTYVTRYAYALDVPTRRLVRTPVKDKTGLSTEGMNHEH